MENTNADDQLDVVGQEEITSGDDNSFNDSSEDTIVIPKSKFNQIRRKANAYDATKGTKTQNINNDSDADWKARMELKVEGHNDEEVNFIMKNGGKAALQDKFVQSAIDALRVQKQAEKAMLGDEGNKSHGTGGLSPQDFSKLSADEQLKALSNLK